VTASGAAAEPRKLGSLPDEVRAAAIVLSNGEVMWARGDAPAALRAIAGTGDRILGLDLRSDGPGRTPRPGIATEIPWADCGSATSEEALGLALAALDSVGDELPDHQSVLVTWAQGPSLPRVALSQHDDGWWAECLICGAWVSTSNPDRRSAEMRFGRHLQHDHEVGGG
jgi:hypothetical protein